MDTDTGVLHRRFRHYLPGLVFPGFRIAAFAVAGFFLGNWARISLGLSGALPGGIFGGLGVGLAMAVAMGIKAVVDPQAKV